MHSVHVFLQVAGRAKSTTAIFARVIFLLEVDQLDMPSKSRSTAELLSTCPAHGA